MLSLAIALAALATALFSDAARARQFRERHVTGTIASYDRESGTLVLEVFAPGGARMVVGPGGDFVWEEQRLYLPILMPAEFQFPAFVGEGFPLSVIAIEDESGVLYASAAYPGGGEIPTMPGFAAPEWEQEPGYELPPFRLIPAPPPEVFDWDMGEWEAVDEDGSHYMPTWTNEQIAALDRAVSAAGRGLYATALQTIDERGVSPLQISAVLGDPARPTPGTLVGAFHAMVTEGPDGIYHLSETYNTRSFGDDENRESFELHLLDQARERLLDLVRYHNRAMEQDDRPYVNALDRWADLLRATSWD